MNLKRLRSVSIFLIICTLVGATFIQPVNAATLKNVHVWLWGLGVTVIESTAEGDVDGDGKKEVVTGGSWKDGSECHHAQLCVWDAATLAFAGVQDWVWGDETWIESVAVGDVDGDG